MTPQERAEHRDKMRSLKTAEERQKFREEHHKQMEQRAKERGVTLPDAPRGPGLGGGPRR
jgi:Spy/CpxP family protein refolding chaperone